MNRPRATEVTALENYKILLTFNNGEKRIFDVTPYLESKYFEPLKKEGYFRAVRTNDMSVEWPGNIDICPDELYYDSIPV